MNEYYIITLFAFVSPPLMACITCNAGVQNAIWNSTFFPNLLMMLSVFFITAIIVVIRNSLAKKKQIAYLLKYPGKNLSPVPLTTTAIILGIGLGGFIDGILFHQVLQWHAMLSNKLPPVTVIDKNINMFWDGVFHLFCFVVVLVGVILLWRLSARMDIDRSGNLLTGGMLLGWGLFNIVEGIINHHILKLHNVCETAINVEAFNIGFISISILITIIGYTFVRKKKKIFSVSGLLPPI